MRLSALPFAIVPPDIVHNKIRKNIMERAGNARREDSDGGDKWVAINEDGPDDGVHKLREALAG